MSSPFLAYLGRLRWIKRWGLMRNAIDENVMEHSFEVAIIAHALALIARRVHGRKIDPAAVAAAALYHDAHEAITGDLPSPIKYHSEAIRRAYRSLEREATAELLLLAPAELRPDYAALMEDEALPPEHLALIKAADRIAAYLKCRAELKAGNTEFESAAAEIGAKLSQLEMPEVDYFLRVFAPCYELNLDRLVGDGARPPR